MWIMPASDSDLTIERGEGTLKVYQFGSKAYEHHVRPVLFVAFFISEYLMIAPLTQPLVLPYMRYISAGQAGRAVN